jgi:stage III sporulation protein SpoIIIAA
VKRSHGVQAANDTGGACCLQVVVIDEIGTEAETHAARTISQRGVQLIATAHGSELDSIIKNPSLVDLVGGVGSVTLGAAACLAGCSICVNMVASSALPMLRCDA